MSGSLHENVLRKHARNESISPTGVRHYYWQWAHLAYSHQIHIGQTRLSYGSIFMSHALDNWDLFFYSIDNKRPIFFSYPFCGKNMPWTAVLEEEFQTPLEAIQTPPRSNYMGLAYSSKMKPYVLIAKISPFFLLSKKQSRQLSWSACSQVRMG